MGQTLWTNLWRFNTSTLFIAEPSEIPWHQSYCDMKKEIYTYSLHKSLKSILTDQAAFKKRKIRIPQHFLQFSEQDGTQPYSTGIENGNFSNPLHILPHLSALAPGQCSMKYDMQNLLIIQDTRFTSLPFKVEPTNYVHMNSSGSSCLFSLQVVPF